MFNHAATVEQPLDTNSCRNPAYWGDVFFDDKSQEIFMDRDDKARRQATQAFDTCVPALEEVPIATYGDGAPLHIGKLEPKTLLLFTFERMAAREGVAPLIKPEPDTPVPKMPTVFGPHASKVEGKVPLIDPDFEETDSDIEIEEAIRTTTIFHESMTCIGAVERIYEGRNKLFWLPVRALKMVHPKFMRYRLESGLVGDEITRTGETAHVHSGFRSQNWLVRVPYAEAYQPAKAGNANSAIEAIREELVSAVKAAIR